MNLRSKSEKMSDFEAITSKIEGVNAVEILKKTSGFDGKATISYEPSITGSRTILAKIAKLGWEWELCDVSTSSLGDEEKRKFQIRFWSSVAFTLPIFILHFIFPAVADLEKWSETEVTPGLSNEVLYLYLFYMSLVGFLIKLFFVSFVDSGFKKVLISAILSTPVQFWVALPLYIGTLLAAAFFFCP